jgi:hypothetical protein
MTDLPKNWDEMSLGALWDCLNDPRRRPTPQTTIEAIIWSVHERGPRALQEPGNIERLRQCDDAAIAEINARIGKLGGRLAS